MSLLSGSRSSEYFDVRTAGGKPDRVPVVIGTPIDRDLRRSLPARELNGGDRNGHDSQTEYDGPRISATVPLGVRFLGLLCHERVP